MGREKRDIYVDTVRRAMRERGLTITGLAARLGVTRQYVGQFLGGHSELGADVLGAMSEELCISPAPYLRWRAEERKRRMEQEAA